MAVETVPSANALTKLFVGDSSDDKPTQNVLAFSLFIESDTGTIFRYSGASWYIATFM